MKILCNIIIGEFWYNNWKFEIGIFLLRKHLNVAIMSLSSSFFNFMKEE